MIADLALKATALLAAGCLAAFVLRRHAASTRHAVWSGLMGAALLLPLVAAVAPSIDVPLLPAAATRETRTAPVARGERAIPTGRTSDLASASPVSLDAAASTLPASPAQIALIAWLAIAMLLVARLAAAHLQARGMLRACGDAPGRLHAALESVARSLGIAAPSLRIAPSGMMPAVIGVRRPAVILPAEAEGWTRERLDLVLLHECAHVRRRDALMQVIAGIATAAYWWHPLAWVAARNIVRERELACDDLVVATGTPAARYAEHLLDIARSMKASREPGPAALAMARTSQLEGRLIALLDERPRGTRTGRVMAAGLMLSLVALVCIAPIRLVARAAATTDHQAVAGAQSARAQADPAPRPAPQARADARPVPKPAAQIDPALNAALFKALDDSDDDIRQMALASLVRHGDPAIRAHLTRALDDPSEDVRATAVAGIRALGHPDKQALLLRAVSDASEDVRSLAAISLADEQGELVAAALAKLAQDISEDVRAAAALALGSRDDEISMRALTAAMSDTSADVRRAALAALARRRF